MNPQTTEERLAASRAVIAERLAARRQHPPPSPLAATVTVLAHDHPWALVSVVAAAGGLLAATRPWRWAFRPAFATGLLSQLAWRALSARRDPPAQ
jgi:hypothetical protein